MAPESLSKTLYTHKSDVWSFGITVWEILTFGARPYQGKSARDILWMLYRGERLKQPATASIELYQILLECEHWQFLSVRCLICNMVKVFFPSKLIP